VRENLAKIHITTEYEWADDVLQYSLLIPYLVIPEYIHFSLYTGRLTKTEQE
jgi:hypothetical protein